MVPPETNTNVVQQFTGDDPEEKILETLGVSDTDLLQDLIIFGAPSVFGVNLGGSVGMELPVFERIRFGESLGDQVAGRSICRVRMVQRG